MKEKNKLAYILTGIISVLFLFFFVTTLLGVIFGGNRLDYYPVCKIQTLLDNKILLLIALTALFIWIALGFFLRKISFSNRLNLITNIILIFIFTGLFFINQEISRCIAFFTGWDVCIISGSAYELMNNVPLGSNYYYSMYPNNIPMAYFLSKLYEYGILHKGLGYQSDTLWIVFNNFSLSVAGFAACMTVKRITRKIMPLLTTLFLYIGCMCFSPWKVIPYSDMYALIFPILSICFFVYSYTSTKTISRYTFWFLACLSGFMGGLVKPSAYITLISVLIIYAIYMTSSLLKNWKEHLIKIAMVFIAAGIILAYRNYIYEETGIIFNPVIRATPQHYFLMGLNEPTTGGYYSDDVALIGKYDQDFEKRTEIEKELALSRLHEKGLLGYLNFLFRKSVMCFNDGTFGWGKEGIFFLGEYHNLSDASYKQLLRDIFRPDALYSGRFNTYSQFIWIIIMCCITGLCFFRDKATRILLNIFPLCLLGVMLYLLLFEARARYLICFLPVWIAAAGLGLELYAEKIYKIIEPHLKK